MSRDYVADGLVVSETLVAAQAVLVSCDHWAPSYADPGSYIAAYRRTPHDPRTDEPVGLWQLYETLVNAAGVKDGEAFVISVSPLNEFPFGDTRMQLTRPHHYERVPVVPQ